MKLGRCPTCHAHIALESICQDDAGRELIALLAGVEAELGRALVAYLGLFRAAKRDLQNDRALALAREVLALSPECFRLADALTETVNALRGKGGLPIKNHNYLIKVFESTPARAMLPALAAPRAEKTRTRGIENDLTDRGWADGLAS
jgi:hypothetical protein